MYDKNRNIDLVKRAAGGDRSAISDLLSENSGLVKSIAVRFQGRGQELEDLIQIGYIGMMKAIRGFDESFGTAFSTYAVHMVTGELRRFLRDDGLIKISRDIKRRGYIIYRAGEEFSAKHGREPKISELCELCDMTYEEVAGTLCAMSPAVSLQEKIGGDEDSASLEELIGVDTGVELTDKLALSEAIEHLSEQEKNLIYLRYYKGLTQSESAKRLGLTQVKVSRHEKKIIQKLREELVL